MVFKILKFLYFVSMKLDFLLPRNSFYILSFICFHFFCSRTSCCCWVDFVHSIDAVFPTPVCKIFQILIYFHFISFVVTIGFEKKENTNFIDFCL